jgi:hypothetical protein
MGGIRLIVIKITDGLGNQMFQYAYARALQIKLSQKIYLDISDINNLQNEQARKSGWVELCDKREYQLDRFMIALPVICTEKLPKRNMEAYKKNKFLRYCEELRLMPTVFLKERDCREKGMRYKKYQHYYVEGSFFDKSYYEDIGSILRQDFQLKKGLCIPDEIDQILKNRNTVSIHIRRGDFLRVGRDMSTDDYYNEAIRYMKDKIRAPFLFIFSDDITWVQNNMKFDLDHMIISGQGFTDSEEIALMSMCKNNIIANSTFSYWGAWLNFNKDKIVISPRGWRQKIIPDTWVQL